MLQTKAPRSDLNIRVKQSADRLSIKLFSDNKAWFGIYFNAVVNALVVAMATDGVTPVAKSSFFV